MNTRQAIRRWYAAALLGTTLVAIGAQAAVAADASPTPASSSNAAGDVNVEMLVTTDAPPGLKQSRNKSAGEKIVIGALIAVGGLAFLFSAVATTRKQNEMLVSGINSELEWRRDRGMI